MPSTKSLLLPTLLLLTAVCVLSVDGYPLICSEPGSACPTDCGEDLGTAVSRCRSWKGICGKTASECAACVRCSYQACNAGNTPQMILYEYCL
ncbi:hypothetical protein BOX15_Mlig033514g1 [Macrostomum lignano]|uniref:ShKT domain-containing protein n=1 Tax=Macrostomum lignano TaxID=282301 RepID=A0A267ESD2_9PLAT|nr:hypothetical protein BOX15_Mlig033514g1 [Macrostomum lignano]